MKRSYRSQLAHETVAILHRGESVSPRGKLVQFSDAMRGTLENTKIYSPQELKRLALQSHGADTRSQSVIEVINETTLQGIFRAMADGQQAVVALNFAYAKNPGGGFLNGSQAQEESLARSSGLYASQQQAMTFYIQHRQLTSCLYTDAMILSPSCPIIRDDEGVMLESPVTATFITAAAPNAGPIANNHPHESELIPEVLRQRADYVLALAHSQRCRTLVLGAWGCGVFRNDPVMVAGVFADHLLQGFLAGAFPACHLLRV